MSKHPTERVRSVQELQATSYQQADKALRRMASAEERIAKLEARLAERDDLINEFREAYGRQADTLSAMQAVVKELESKIARGVDQVLTGLEGRIAELERETPAACQDLRELIEMVSVSSSTNKAAIENRLSALETKPKRGRPKGSKNKPKDTLAVERQIEKQDNNPQISAPVPKSDTPALK